VYIAASVTEQMSLAISIRQTYGSECIVGNIVGVYVEQWLGPRPSAAGNRFSEYDRN